MNVTIISAGCNECYKAFSSKWSVSINESTTRKLYLEKLKEASKNKFGDKISLRAYPYIKKSHDPTIALLPIKFLPIGKFSLFTKFFLSQIFRLYGNYQTCPGNRHDVFAGVLVYILNFETARLYNCMLEDVFAQIDFDVLKPGAHQPLASG